MGLLRYLFSSRKDDWLIGGRIYSMTTVKEEHRSVAERALAENLYTLETRNGPDNFSARLHTDPPLRAMIRMDRSLGEPAAMIITAVYEI